MDVEDEEEDDDVEERKPIPRPGSTLVGACAIEMHMSISQEPFCVEICRKNGQGHLRGQRFARARAVETHMDISEDLFCVEI